MSDKKIVYSSSIGKPWQSLKPDNRRKMNVKDKKGKK